MGTSRQLFVTPGWKMAYALESRGRALMKLEALPWLGKSGGLGDSCPH